MAATDPGAGTPTRLQAREARPHVGVAEPRQRRDYFRMGKRGDTTAEGEAAAAAGAVGRQRAAMGTARIEAEAKDT